MISKELLSEILGVMVESIHISNNVSEINYTVSMGGYKYINIHELAFLCKEWAYKNGTAIASTFYPDKKLDGTNMPDCYCMTAKVGKIFTYDNIFEADTEPEAIFKACQWILKEMK